MSTSTTHLNEKGHSVHAAKPRLPDEERAQTTVPSHQVNGNGVPTYEQPYKHHLYPTRGGFVRFKDRFLRKGKKKVGVLDSLKAIALSSWLNVFLIFIPLSWVAHFNNESNKHHGVDPDETHFPYPVTFVFSLLAIIPLEKLFDFGGEQMAFYVGKDLGDLIMITLNNAVEATLAIILLTKCEIKLLQSTIIGVVVLHLLLIPGTAFITGGARVIHQDLSSPHLNELNHTLLVMGVLTLLLPAAFFAAIDRGTESISSDPSFVVNDSNRRMFLTISHGLAVILLLVYIASRIYLHNPPGDDNALKTDPNAPVAVKHEEDQLLHEEPEVSQWVCIAMLVITIALMAATAEWLVDSVEFVRERQGLQEEWFGMILLPVVSFAADGMVAIAYFARWLFWHLLGRSTPPATLAKARAIDLSIQFTLFWMPFIVLLGWWTNKPLSLLFDIYEVAVLLGSCFLVNYVTADAKTNWAEGFAMVAFYIMIAMTTWFYPGQPEVEEMLSFGQCLAAGGAEG
ncbi:hypothetical protein V5O48_001124 [Marasmius crinis-equi]|uniref:Sodium/calcium exchanger membrane region domain-containing protein n=1 Tax=Marasmius crinis-equi TaxID=585013 RepID=A0ABR3FZD2_9AGAR